MMISCPGLDEKKSERESLCCLFSCSVVCVCDEMSCRSRQLSQLSTHTHVFASSFIDGLAKDFILVLCADLP